MQYLTPAGFGVQGTFEGSLSCLSMFDQPWWRAGVWSIVHERERACPAMFLQKPAGDLPGSGFESNSARKKEKHPKLASQATQRGFGGQPWMLAVSSEPDASSASWVQQF